MAEQIKFGDRLFLKGEKVIIDNGEQPAVIASKNENLVIEGQIDINQGSIDGTTIGADTPESGNFTFIAGDGTDIRNVLTHYTTDDLVEGTGNMYFTNERVDDRVNEFLVTGFGLSKVYDDEFDAISLDIAAMNVGTGAAVFCDDIPNVLTFRSIIAGPSSDITITISENQEIIIDTATQISSLPLSTFQNDNGYQTLEDVQILIENSSVTNNVLAQSVQSELQTIASKFRSDQSYTVGTVVVFGGTHQVTTTTTETDYKIAGVVTENPALLLNAIGDIPEALYAIVASHGIAVINVVGTVSVGDLLVTSSTAGYAIAKAANDVSLTFGSILGKAIEEKNTTENGQIMAYISTM